MNLHGVFLLIVVVLVCNYVNGELSDVNLRGNKDCDNCKMAINALMYSAKADEPFYVVELKVKLGCQVLGVESEVCSGIINVFVPTVLECLKRVSINAGQICSMIMEDLCPSVDVPEHEWTVQLPDITKPLINQEEFVLQEGAPKLKVLQLSDIHLDLLYSEDTVANCNQPLCCRKSSVNKPNEIFLPSGRWSAYNCDLPLETFKKTLKHIANQHHDIDYIILTGDVVPHDIWKHTRSGILEAIKTVYAEIKQTFPNTLVLPNIGNHELVPSGMFTPSWVTDQKYTMSWLLSELNALWRDWLPSSANETILQGGFYSVLIRPGLKIVSLNTNFCHHLNFWLYVNSKDPEQQLQWFIDELQKAENNGEKVHVIGHIPPGDYGCLKSWSASYYKIINRYEKTITGQFFGHTHFDEYIIFYDDEHYERPVGVGYIAPSLTAHEKNNLAYRIYYIDGYHKNSTWEVLDHETWMLDLDKANAELQEVPEWMYCYSAKATYNLRSLKPVEWNKLLQQMDRNTSLFKTFYKHYHRNSPVSKPFSIQLKQDILCKLKSGKSHSKKLFCSEDIE